jgi:hypothetical protein
MRIETHEGLVSDAADTQAIARAVSSLTDPAKAFVVLSDPRSGYIQAAGCLDEGFIVEYRDGRAGDHFRGDARIGPIALANMLNVYLRREPSWRSEIAWHRVIVDDSSPAA